MGASSSTLARIVKDEFLRVSNGKSYLVLDEFLAFRFTSAGWALDPGHVGILFAVDRDKDGRVTLSDMLAFAQHVNQQLANTQPYELQSIAHSTCMLQLWRRIQSAEGLASVVDWLISLALENVATVQPSEGAHPDVLLAAQDSAAEALVTNLSGITNVADLRQLDDRPRAFPQHPGITFLHKQSLSGLHRVLGHQVGTQPRPTCAQVHDTDAFIHTLQRVAEEGCMLELSDPALDDWVPEPVLRDYLAEVLTNMKQLVSDMDLLQSLLIDDAAA